MSPIFENKKIIKSISEEKSLTWLGVVIAIIIVLGNFSITVLETSKTIILCHVVITGST